MKKINNPEIKPKNFVKKNSERKSNKPSSPRRIFKTDQEEYEYVEDVWKQATRSEEVKPEPKNEETRKKSESVIFTIPVIYRNIGRKESKRLFRLV